MAQAIDLQKFTDERGNLVVIEKALDFDIRRIFYIYGVDTSVRGGHRHHKTRQAAICLRGQCVIECENGQSRQTFALSRPDQCVILEPEDWHVMHGFTADAILMVVASEYFDPADYIYERYGTGV
jgi:hypothetical protein